MSSFHPIVTQWFADTLGSPTSAQERAWTEIRDGRHLVMAAPTGSGKTLAAFLTALDDLFKEGLEKALPDEVRVIYVSPLKALSADIHKNLALPRRGISRLAAEHGLEPPRITAALRTGDTTQAERASMIRTPPHILVTTPESLFLLLTADRSRQMLRTARTVIVDEIHAVIGTRRGAHLAISLERLQQLIGAPVRRIGLSATQRPIEAVARYLVGELADCAIVDEGHRRALDLTLEIPKSPLEVVMSHEIWEEYYERLMELINTHRTTLVFVNTRRLAERLARHLSERLGPEAVTAHHGSLAKEKRLDAETRLKNGQLKALIATASLELGIDVGHVDLVCQVGSPHRIATLLQRVGRAGHTLTGTPKGRVFPLSRDDLVETIALLRSIRSGELDRILQHDAPVDVLAQQIVAETACEEYSEDDLFTLVRRAWPYRALERQQFDAVLQMVAEGFSTKRGRRAALVHRDEVNRLVRARRGSRMLALTSGGAIQDIADYRVLLEPDDTFIGTLNEDFAIESMAGDIFQLGNASWQVLRVGTGIVRVADAKGAPPTIPFWLGEAPARSDELSRAVSTLRGDVEQRILANGSQAAPSVPSSSSIARWLADEAGVQLDAAAQAVAYLQATHDALGAIPTQETLVLERFFDESGGMQLVLHAPFGSRINKAWGLALRKRFCRQFNFELQAAATEDAVLLSLGPQHSFPLADVFRYLHPSSVRDVLVQAMLDAPVFQTRWRWNTTISLAVPRARGSRRVPSPLQRMVADDLLASVFPDAAACLENIPGDRQIPGHPLVTQTIRDCLDEAMDLGGLVGTLTKVHAGEIRLITRDVPEPSPIAHEILNARPYAFLDDAPLEERRTQAVSVRRAINAAGGNDLGALDAAAISRVRDEERPDPRDPDELHDALMTAGFLTRDDAEVIAPAYFETLVSARRATRCVMSPDHSVWAAAERIPELLAVHAAARLEPAIEPPANRAARGWTRSDAIAELVRSRMSQVGPTTAAAVAVSLGVGEHDVHGAMLVLESQGLVLRGRFTGGSELEWCDRRLLARIHRYTLNRLRAEIEPVSLADLMRFLFVWQHVDPAHHLSGIDGLRAILAELDGYELPARAWERNVLPARLDKYDKSMLDMLCLTGYAAWGRLSCESTIQSGSVESLHASRVDSVERAPHAPAKHLPGAVKHVPVALFLRDHAAAWQALGSVDVKSLDTSELALSTDAREVLTLVREKGASFFREVAWASRLPSETFRGALMELVARGLICSDGFAGVRELIRRPTSRPLADTGSGGLDFAGRWWAPDRGDARATDPAALAAAREAAVELQARVLLRRYGVVCRRLLAREPNAAPWRELSNVYRRLEARGEIRGGRFVASLSGEQFALPEAVERLREVRRTRKDGRLIVISAVDPLNLVGIITAGDRVRASGPTRIAYRDGIPLAVLEGDYMKPLADIEPAIAGEVASALAGRRVPAVTAGFVGAHRG